MNFDSVDQNLLLKHEDEYDANVLCPADSDEATHIYKEKKCILLVPENEAKYENHQKKTFICGLNIFNHFTPKSTVYQDFKLKLPECETMRNTFTNKNVNPIFL